MLFAQFNINWEALFNRWLLGLFSLCGFCPTIEGKEKRVVKIALMAWSLMHIVVAITLAFFAFHTFVTHDSDVANFNNILKFSIMVLTYFATCIESVAVRNNFIEIGIRIKAVDNLIGKMLPNYNSILNKFYKETTRTLILAMFFTFVIELVIIVSIYEVSNWRFMWGISIVPVLISRLRHLHHSLFIEMLSCRFGVIKNELKLIAKLTKENNKLMKKKIFFYEELFRKLSTIKSVYNTLWETSLLINRSFGVSQLINLLQNFIQLTCDLYLVYSYLYKNNMTYITGDLNNHLLMFDIFDKVFLSPQL